MAANLAAGNLIVTATGLHFDIVGTVAANGVGGSFTVAGSAPIVATTPTLGGFVAGTTGITGVTIDATNVAAATNNGTYNFVITAAGDMTITKGTAGTPQTILAANLAAAVTITDGALTVLFAGTAVANGTGGSFSVGNASGGSAGAVQPTWPTTVTDGVTTVADGNLVWTMYNNPTYV